MKIKCYLAQKMSSRYCDEMVKEARKIRKIFKKEGVEIISPVLDEGIPNKHVKLDYVTKAKLLKEWQLDKHARIRNKAHVVYNANGHMASNGVTIERGWARWYLWRPVVTYIPENKYFYSITDIEEDSVQHNHRTAARFIRMKWGTRSKWISFKLPHLFFGIPKFIYRQVKSLWL
jgi:hypothetical protein